MLHVLCIRKSIPSPLIWYLDIDNINVNTDHYFPQYSFKSPQGTSCLPLDINLSLIWRDCLESNFMEHNFIVTCLITMTCNLYMVTIISTSCSTTFNHLKITEVSTPKSKSKMKIDNVMITSFSILFCRDLQTLDGFENIDLLLIKITV